MEGTNRKEHINSGLLDPWKLIFALLTTAVASDKLKRPRKRAEAVGGEH